MIAIMQSAPPNWKQTYVIEFLHMKKVAPIDTDLCLLKIYVDQAVG